MVVYIVGAGPGDPGLVTLRAKHLISRAQVIIYDKLVNPAVLNWAPADCEIIYMGKREKGSSSSQELQKDINELIKEHGRDKFVVRLKGGDPFIFGRGGEEAQECVKEGIPFEIVPGISSSYAAPAYAGIPISHRDFNSSFAVLTGHESDKDDTNIDWVHLPENIVVLMGVSQIKDTAKKLLEAGRSPETPVAAIYKGTTVEEKTELSTLETLAEKGTSLKPPVIFVIGPIASLHSELSWFEKKVAKASGKKVVLTRASEHLEDSIPLFQQFGMESIPMPLIQLVDREFEVPDIHSYDALVFTSQEGVKRATKKIDLKDYKGKIFTIGPKTKNYVKDIFGLNASMGEEYNSGGLAAHILDNLTEGSSILTLRSSAATAELKDKLSGKFEVNEIYVYDVKQLPADPEKIVGSDAVFIVSASCAKSISALDDKVLAGKTVVSIGPETSRHLRFEHITASQHTIDGMIEAYIDYLWTGIK
jgi:uroporphyrinogen III methyltransferase/synthase